MSRTADNHSLQAVRITAAGPGRSYRTDNREVTTVPLTIRRRQNRKILIPPPQSESALATGGIDVPMIKTLGKAFYWLRLLETGKFRTISDLARSERLEVGWVAEVLRLTLLSPDIIETILAGQQPRHLNLHLLRGRGQDWPRSWMEQQRVLYANADD